jgi:SAM-dependent methyltransferase
MTMAVSTFSAKSIGFGSNSTIVSMLTDDEKALYFDVARSYRGTDRVMEIGPWLGSGTFQICQGLEASGHPWSLTVVDRFRWSELYERRYPEIGLKAGDEFLSLFRRNLDAYAGKLTCIEAELTALSDAVPIQNNIDILFVDAPKSWSMLWAVLHHVGPHLMAGSRLVFQDFLHITSRQLIWLLASIPQLKLHRLVESGTAAAFVADGPLDMESIAPRSINALGPADLLKIWRSVRNSLPEERSGELAVGMALDLLQKNALDDAKNVLDEAALNKPWSELVVAEVDRLIRYSDKKNIQALIEVAAYLKAGVHPLAVRASRAVQEREDLVLKEPKPGTPSASTSETLRLAESLRSPSTAGALGARCAMHMPMDRGKYGGLLPVFDAAVKSGGTLWPVEVQDIALGRDVVELNCGITLHGFVMRALGARSYRGVHQSYDPGHRTYASSVAGMRVKTKYSIQSVAAQIPDLAYATAYDQIADRSADVVFVRASGAFEELEHELAEAKRILRPNGHLWFRWNNAFSWSGHGQTPRRAVEIQKNDPNHRAVLDWRHIKRIPVGTPTIAEVRQLVNKQFKVASWTSELDDPAVVVRLSKAALDAHPTMTPSDFVTASTTAIAQM